MSERQILEELTDINQWKLTFLVLAMDRYQPWLQHIGVPETMAAEPSELAKAARYFWEKRLQMSNIPSLDREDFRRTVNAVLRDSLAILTEGYGHDDAADFERWVQELCVNSELRGRWWTWSLLFYRLAVQGFEGASQSNSREHEKILATVREHFAPSFRQAQRARLEAAIESPQTAFEALIAATEPGVVESAAEHIEELVGMHHAFLVWGELSLKVSEPTLGSLISWARAEAASIGMPAEAVVRPALP